MKLKKMIFWGVLFSLFLTGCDWQRFIDENVDRVVLEVKDKANILPSTLTQDQVSYSGFPNGTFALSFKAPFVFDDAEGTVSITFYLQNDKATSKERTISLFGFKKASSDPADPTNPSEVFHLTEAQLLTAFSLVKGAISASDAAEKIEFGPWVGQPQLLFTHKDVLRYDDQAGTLSVHMKGRYQDKSFDNRFDLTGFTHPYEGVSLQSPDYADNYLIFDEAIENNYSLAKFIEKANAAKGVGFVKVSYALSNGESASIGGNAAYALEARLSQDGTNVKIYVNFGPKYKKFDGATTIETVEISFTKQVYGNHRYFTEKDVYEYVSGKVKGDADFITVNAAKFASYIYAKTFLLNQGGSLFELSKIQKYRDLYAEKGADEHLEIVGLGAGVYELRNGGLDANDYDGSLKVMFYISKANVISVGGGSINQISTPQMIVRTGYKKIAPDNQPLSKAALDLFAFGLMPELEATPEKWKAYGLANGHLIRMNTGSTQPNYSDWVLVNADVLKRGNGGKYFLLLNGAEYASSSYPSFGNNFCSDTTKGEIFVKQITLSKIPGDPNLLFQIQFMGREETVDFTINPTP